MSSQSTGIPSYVSKTYRFIKGFLKTTPGIRHIYWALLYIKYGQFRAFYDLRSHNRHNIGAGTLELVDIVKWIRSNYTDSSFTYNADYRFDDEIYIIVPVYNGYEFLDALFKSIPLTNLNYKLIIVDDKSPDGRVTPYLQKLAASDERITLIENKENIGFVKSVNKAFGYVKGHVALLNTDIELPQCWLERLMYPIVFNRKVASSTPFTNAGTICSFPVFCEDNKLFEDLSALQIDEFFSRIKPDYTAIPTGVGFCMGMNYKAIKKIGLFDEDTFSRGYGEENDWCQRAIKAGYKNVMVENLFVYHKHGGSFSSIEKRKLAQQNNNRLVEKHPSYPGEVADFCMLNPLKPIRDFVIFYLLFNYTAKKKILVFNHIMGGGATKYLTDSINREIRENNVFIIVKRDIVNNLFIIDFKGPKHFVSYRFDYPEELFEILSNFPCSEIRINELVTYPDLYNFMNIIISLKSKMKATLKMLLHDYYSICPSIYLINNDFKYCDLPQPNDCFGCFISNPFMLESDKNVCVDIQTWRNNWSRFLSHCDEIVAFSDCSASLLRKVYKKLPDVSITPHHVDFIPLLNKKFKTTNTLNIGIIGVLAPQKGYDFVCQMLSLINEKNLNIRIVLLGFSNTSIQNKHFIETGEYNSAQIAPLTLEYDIDLFLITSIWPETYSYTCREVMEMDMPVACFNMGAPAERVAAYSKGLVIDKIDAETALVQISSFVMNNQELNHISEYISPTPREIQSVLFIIEVETFSSRYRVDHFKEQLLLKGVACDINNMNNVTDEMVEHYNTFVIYRCPYTDRLGSFIDTCHRSGKKVFYDIDDFIFDYDNIKHLPFLANTDYPEYEIYSSEIKQSMSLCDGYITSTNQMAQVINAAFIDKPLCINRNVASLELFTCSQIAKNTVIKDDSRIVLCYSSGSTTHNNDFATIEDVLISLLDRYENLHVTIIGLLDISNTLLGFGYRVKHIDLVVWQDLPALIAETDINLMPLEDDLFHWCKSENKWMEAALVEVPTVCSHNPELMSVIDNGVTGFLCKTPVEWEDTLSMLIEDPALRAKIGKTAYNTVVDKYITSKTGYEAMKFIIE